MKNFTDSNFQQHFFAELAVRFPSKKDMVTDIGKTLQLGRDGIYRRLRGETNLSAEELIKLARTYNVKLDTKPDTQYLELHLSENLQEIRHETDWFELILAHTKKIGSLPGITVCRTCSELPITYLLSSPTLLAYTTFLNGINAWNFKHWQKRPFKPTLLDPRIHQLAQSISNHAFSCPVQEIWSVHLFNKLLESIIHGIAVNLIQDQNLVRQMFTEIDTLVDRLEQLVMHGQYPLPRTNGRITAAPQAEVTVHHSELIGNSNIVLIKSPQQNTFFTTLISPTHVQSSTPHICQHVSNWLDNIFETSDVMNSNSLRNVKVFFARVRQQVNAAKNAIDGSLPQYY